LVVICLSNYSTGSLSESHDSSTDSDSDREAGSELDDRPAQKKQKIDNTQVRTVRDDLLAIDDLILEGPDYQDHYSGQDPYNESMKLLATAVVDEPVDGGLKEDSDVISSSQNHENRSQSLHMTPTLAAPAATAAQELLAALDGQPDILAATSLMESTLDDPERHPQVAVADDKQEWEICDIVGKEDIDGVPHYWVQWSVTLVPKHEMGKARALVARFDAGLRAQGKQKGGKGRGRLPPSKPGKRAIAQVRTKGETQKKRGRGRPRKQV
jgi:hypothetical protein